MKTEKRHCCKIGCKNEAKVQIWFGETTDDYTESCQDHINDLTPIDCLPIIEKIN